ALHARGLEDHGGQGEGAAAGRREADHLREARRRGRSPRGAQGDPGPRCRPQAVQRDRAQVRGATWRLHADPQARTASGRRRADGAHRAGWRGVVAGAQRSAFARAARIAELGTVGRGLPATSATPAQTPLATDFPHSSRGERAAVRRLTIAYDGTDFRGWARQAGQRTVQGTLEIALQRILGFSPRLSVAGRTDAGVHARANVISFRAQADPEALQRALNRMLAPEVVVRDARSAPDGFDARRSASARIYRYRIDMGPIPDPFTARFAWHRPGMLPTTPMRAAARHLVGEHDFASFCRAGRDGASMIRRLDRLSIAREGSLMTVAARANAFCHQMVRSLVGTLVDAGEGR